MNYLGWIDRDGDNRPGPFNHKYGESPNYRDRKHGYQHYYCVFVFKGTLGWDQRFKGSVTTPLVCTTEEVPVMCVSSLLKDWTLSPSWSDKIFYSRQTSRGDLKPFFIKIFVLNRRLLSTMWGVPELNTGLTRLKTDTGTGPYLRWNIGKD